MKTNVSLILLIGVFFSCHISLNSSIPLSTRCIDASLEPCSGYSLELNSNLPDHCYRIGIYPCNEVCDGKMAIKHCFVEMRPGNRITIPSKDDSVLLHDLDLSSPEQVHFMLYMYDIDDPGFSRIFPITLEIGKAFGGGTFQTVGSEAADLKVFGWRWEQLEVEDERGKLCVQTLPPMGDSDRHIARLEIYVDSSDDRSSVEFAGASGGGSSAVMTRRYLPPVSSVKAEAVAPDPLVRVETGASSSGSAAM